MSSATDLITIIRRQREFSSKTFGAHSQWRGTVAHIRKELVEIEEACGTKLVEWVDVVLLGLDGAWRSGASPEQIVEGIAAKQTINEERKWPDWRSVPPGEPIEHLKREEEG